MIYVDSSVALAHIFGERATPPRKLWDERLASSLLLRFEVWNRIHARGLGESLANETQATLARIELFEMSEEILERALAPFPLPIRTLDGLHLATMDYLITNDHDVELASYDQRLNAAAEALRIPLYAL